MSESTVVLTPAVDRHELVRERRFTASQLSEVLLLLKSERFTGCVYLDFSQGSLCAIRSQERAPLNANGK